MTWLLALVVAPCVILLVYSFCDRDEFGEVIYTFTLDNYKRIFAPELLPIFGKTLLCGSICAAICFVASFKILIRHKSLITRLGAVIGMGAYLSYAIRHTDEDAAAYLRIFWRSTEIAGMTTVLCLLLGYPVAYFIGRCTPAWRARLLMAVMVPFWTSFLIRTYAWITILNQQGLLNAALKAMKLSVLIPASGGLLYTPTAVVIGLVYAYLPFMILPIFTSVEKLDNSLIEASLDLGAGPWRTLLHVILPLTQPGVAAGITLVFVPAIGMFAVTDLMSGGRVLLIGETIQNQFGQARDWPFGAALGVTLMSMFLIVMLINGKRQGDKVRG